MIRDRRSRPKASVPRRWAVDPPSSQNGGMFRSKRFWASGSCGARSGAKIADSPTARSTSRENREAGLVTSWRHRLGTAERSLRSGFAGTVVFWSVTDTDPRVESGVDEVDDQVEGNDHDGHDDDEGLDDDEVPVVDRPDGEHPHAGVAEDRLGHDGTS